MNQVHLWQEEAIAADGYITLSATFEAPQQSRKSLWYRVPLEYSDYLTHSCDPFVIATLFVAMSQSADLVVHGEVSPSLIHNLEEFQSAWSCWRPDHYHPVAIQAETEQELVKASSEERAITAFSGGVDSCYTALRHRRGLCKRSQRNLQTGMLVHGFDIPLRQTDSFDKAVEGSRVMLSSLGMDLIPLATNFRQVVRLNWEDVFGAAIASCLTLFRNHYTTGLIPASYSYHTLAFPYGSNPVSDRLLSSQSFEIVHDGADSGRIHKIRHLANWDEGLRHLRVCWEGADKYRNCGRCEKCIRNILNFRIIGIDSPPCFDHLVTNQEVRSLRVKNAQLDALKFLLRAAQDANISDSWVHALEQAIHRNQRIEFIKSCVPDSLKQQLKQSQFFSKR
ncbi:hypothetical protein H6G89_26035 [Oscillatoria sp. FACHB-1407]|uniref:hypothetical protein n=1 Tax=Oscillatoria sp. FACHB-1407 TaxID=2692847 RepID=UPI00168356CE|nr:hypothetical protein [Oscillatoria sp. FACHB-1407]MBD2464470.1 hypothetical protein [Oscillatoria sp. FACHB-1407]